VTLCRQSWNIRRHARHWKTENIDMKVKIEIVAYVATAILAAYASYDLVTEAGGAYHFSAVTKASCGVALFAFLTGAMWTTIAQSLALLASERRYSWFSNISKFVSFAVGYSCLLLFAWGVSSDGTAFWLSAIGLIGAVVGMGTFACVHVFAAPEKSGEASVA
jgi:small-conductance mechanosensitive channel